MINLLPDETKQEIRAARTNITLINYMIFLGLALVFLVLACSTTYLLLLNSEETNEKNAAANQSKITPYSSVETQANALTNSLLTAKNVLNQQVSYSNVIMGIAAVLPSGTVLNSLSLNSSTFGTPMTIQVHTSSADNEPKLKENFQKSPLFSNYSLQSIENNPSDSSGHPVTISIRITINKGVAQ